MSGPRRPPLRKPPTAVRRPRAAAFQCPACGAASRIRLHGDAQVFDCPECGAGLLAEADGEGGAAVRPVGGNRPEKRTPLWPFALAAVGVVSAAAAGWVVLSGGPAERAAAPLAPAEADAAAPIARPKIVRPPEPPRPRPPEPSTALAGPRDAEREPTPAPSIVTTTDAGEGPEPARPAAVAPRPGGELTRRRTERRLRAPIAGFSLPRPTPLAEAVEPLEDLLRVRIDASAAPSVPVTADFAGPVPVAAVLERLARQAGLRAEVTATGVRLVPPGGSE